MFSRRDVLKGTGAAFAGLTLGFALPRPVRADAAPHAGTAPGSGAHPAALNAWLRIGADETVTILCPGYEIGQGTFSSLPALVAEELEVDWSRVRVVQAPLEPELYRNLFFNEQITAGSTNVRWAFEPLRKAGAAARELLREAAAGRWNVALADCVARSGFIEHAASGRRASYGELAVDAAKLTPPADPPLKPRESWRLLGTSFPRLELPSRVDGSAIFGPDVVVDGMLVAAVRLCPVAGGTLEHVDPAPALAIEGCRAVVPFGGQTLFVGDQYWKGLLPLESAVIVVADRYWAAKKGLEALRPVWKEGAGARLSTDTQRAAPARAVHQPGDVLHAEGDAAGALAAADRVIEATYEVPYLAHAAIEPQCATAHVTSRGATIWAPTQLAGRARPSVAAVLGIRPEQVEVHATCIGGSFGSKGAGDSLMHAAVASRAVGAPVKVIWSREEDLRHETYRPAAHARLRAGLDAQGELRAWQCALASQPVIAGDAPPVRKLVAHLAAEGAAHLPYSIANQETSNTFVATGLPVGFWRSVGHSQNTFFVQSFLDEVAHAAGTDPLAFQLALLAGKPRHRAVLERAAAMIDWPRPVPKGRGRGLALQECYGSIAAQACDVSLGADGRLTIHRITCAVDCGTAVHPDNVVAQIEGGIVFGLTAALIGEITVKEGRVQEGNYDRYPLLGIVQMPRIEVTIIESGAKIGGVGEVGVPHVAPALGNAIFAASGRRIRSLPLRRHGITLA